MRKQSIIIILISVLFLAAAQVSEAAVINVTTVVDDIPGSLRAAIKEANLNGEADIINLPAGRYYLHGKANENRNLSGDLDIFNSQAITIRGENAGTTLIDADRYDRVLHILSGVVSIYNVTFQGGKSGNSEGGGIYNSGDLTLINCVIRNNDTWGDSKAGGGIYNNGSLVLTNCTISNNTTRDEYWGKSGGDGAGIYNNESLTLTNCTICDNKNGKGGDDDCHGGNGGSGGGIFNNSGGSVVITNCTISGNSAGVHGSYTNDDPLGCRWPSDGSDGRGGGICNDGEVIIKNTIIANNTGDGPDCYGKLNSQGYNLIQQTGQCRIMGTRTGNIIGLDPLLRVLDDNGGPTKTQALRQGSPAIDAGNSFGLTTDQRGFVRPHNIANIPDAYDGSDIGAFEYASVLPSPSYNISGKITCYGVGLPGVTLVFSNNGGSTTTDANGNYSHSVPYSWSGTVTPAKEGYTFNPPNRNYTAVIADQPNQDFTAISNIPPQISLNRTQLTFGMNTDGIRTGPQSFSIANSGGGILKWTTGNSCAWLNCSPNSGTGSATITVSIDPPELTPDTYTEMITISAFNAVNSPQTVNVTLNVYDAGSTDLPFGSFDSPISGSTVSGSIPVTGWVLDNIGVESVKIYRNPAAGEGDGLVYIGAAIFVEEARPDIASHYPNYPNNYKAGWGYMLLTNALPGQGNGDFTLYAQAADMEGNIVTLGSTAITCDNANAVKPFGAIDTPMQGGTVSGNDYANYGWVLTPQPNTILTSGSTINVWVDGVSLGHPVYNESRPDVAALFPNYNNSNRAGGHFYLDAAKWANGVHTIAWTAADNAGNADGIGSRYFTVQNSEAGDRGQGSGVREKRRGAPACAPILGPSSSGIDWYGPFKVKKGFNADIEANEVYPAEDRKIYINIRELERVEIHLWPGVVNVSALPIGSTLDVDRGIFYWQPGPGFIGDYEFTFLVKTRNDGTVTATIAIKIKAKSKRGGDNNG